MWDYSPIQLALISGTFHLSETYVVPAHVTYKLCMFITKDNKDSNSYT